MKFAISALIVSAACASKVSHFGEGLSFLDSPESFEEAKSARDKFLEESVKLAAIRSIKVTGYFNARDQAASMKKTLAVFLKAFKGAKSLAAAKKALHLTSIHNELEASAAS